MSQVTVSGEKERDQPVEISSEPLSILFFIHTPKDPATAVFSTVKRKAEILMECGHSAEVLAPEDFPTLASKIGARWYTLVYPWAIAFHLLRRTDMPDLVVFHSYAGWAFHWIQPLFPRLRGIRTATQFHGLEPLFFEQVNQQSVKLSLRYRIMQEVIANRLIRSSCKRSGQVQILNSDERDYLVRHGWAAGDRVVLDANAVDEDTFLGRDNRGAGDRLLFLGQWEERKGIRSLAKSFADSLEKNPNLRLTCVGTLRDASSVLEDFPERARRSVTVVPRIPHAEVKNYLREADVFVFPTLFEGFSIALLEAMAAGLAIVTTRVAAASDLLEDDVSALFVPANEPAKLSEAIAQLASDPALRERLGREAQLKAREFTWARVGRNYELMLRAIRPRHAKDGARNKTR